MTTRTLQRTVDDDIIVNIHRLHWCAFEGTAEQLSTEGLLSVSDVAVLERREASAREVWRMTRDGQRQAALYGAAKQDATLQTLLRTALGQRKVGR